MGLLRRSSASAPTATTPASTTLSARPRFVHRHPLAAAGVVTCAGVFSAVLVNAGANSPRTPSSTPSVARSTLQLNLDQQQAPPTPSTPPPDTPTGHTQTTISASSSGTNAPATSVTVNGQPVDVPSNGSITQTVANDGGQTTLEVNTSTDGSSTNRSFTSLSVNVSSSSTSSDSSP